MGVYSRAPFHVRCVLAFSVLVQVTVTEKDRAIQEMERAKEGAVQQKERAVREKEEAIQRLQVCSSHTCTHSQCIVLNRLFSLITVGTRAHERLFGSTPHVRCVLTNFVLVQVTVTEKDRAIQEMERANEGAVREKERAVRDKEVAIQRLQVCSSHTCTHSQCIVLNRPFSLITILFWHKSP